MRVRVNKKELARFIDPKGVINYACDMPDFIELSATPVEGEIRLHSYMGYSEEELGIIIKFWLERNPPTKEGHLHCKCMNLGKTCPNNHYSDCNLCHAAPVVKEYHYECPETGRKVKIISSPRIEEKEQIDGPEYVECIAGCFHKKDSIPHCSCKCHAPKPKKIEKMNAVPEEDRFTWKNGFNVIAGKLNEIIERLNEI